MHTQIRPAFQLFGTEKVTWVYAFACHLDRAVRENSGILDVRSLPSCVGRLSTANVQVGKHLWESERTIIDNIGLYYSRRAYEFSN